MPLFPGGVKLSVAIETGRRKPEAGARLGTSSAFEG